MQQKVKKLDVKVLSYTLFNTSLIKSKTHILHCLMDKVHYYIYMYPVTDEQILVHCRWCPVP